MPTFGCVVYVSAGEGGVRARVANLVRLECTAETERGALSKLIPAFKSRVAELPARGEPIPWLDPLLGIAPTEQRRFVPVHL